MATRTALVGREAECARLDRALQDAGRGRGGLVLLSGEAGVGKTRLAEELAAAAAGPVLSGAARQGAAAAYGPVVAAFRSHLRGRPDALEGCGLLRAHLALILPELGEAAPSGDGATLVEAVHAGLAHVAREEPVLVLLDDLQWSDDATLELLATLAEPLARLPVVVVAGYRSDGLSRDHAVRRLRTDLRRAGRLEELALAPLELDGTAALLAQVLGGAPAPSLARTVHDRTQGVPFFVEELARALCATDALAAGRDGLELVEGGQVPVPDTVRDAVLMAASELSREARDAAEAAAVAGEAFDLDVVAAAAGASGLAELAERGVIAEDGLGRGAFRHTLTRDAFYAEVPWLRRRALHRCVAEALEAGGGRSAEVATHWLGARDEARARDALLRAADESRAVHAHGDAVRAGRHALELWPEDDDAERRIAALSAYAASAELSGRLAEAARAWREISALADGQGARERMAVAERRLAAVHNLTGDREAALSARRTAAAAFAAADRHSEAAVERLAIAAAQVAGASYPGALDAAREAVREAGAAGRHDLSARALGLESAARARAGDLQGARDRAQAGLALALEHGPTSVAAELYQRLGVVLYHGADYRSAETTLDTALELCRGSDAPDVELETVICMVYVLRESGAWERSEALGCEQIATGRGAWLAEGLIGSIHGYRGRSASGRRLLTASLATATRVGHFVMTVDCTSALGWIAAAEGAGEDAMRLHRAVLVRSRDSEDHHYAVRGLRVAASYLARHGDLESAHGCASALTRIAADTAMPDALAALAHAIGEMALADGDAVRGAEQIVRALELHRGLDIPLDRAEIALRAGAALEAAGERARALEALREAHRTARRLGSRPLAVEAAREAAALGQPLGRRAAADAEGGGLSRRELEVVRLVAAGSTNREIASALVLSPRTVDMHVRNLLLKLDSRSRVDAVRRAGELGLLT